MPFYTGGWNKSTRLFVLGYENGTTIALQKVHRLRYKKHPTNWEQEVEARCGRQLEGKGHGHRKIESKNLHGRGNCQLDWHLRRSHPQFCQEPASGVHR